MQRIIDEYNNNWKHRALGCTPLEARQKLPYPQDYRLDPNIWHLLWATRTPEWMDDDGNDTFDSDLEFEMRMSSKVSCQINERRAKKA
jgi:hypothetical protein